MGVDKDELRKMAKLARLEFTDTELESMRESLGQLVEYLDILRQLKLDGVEPMMTADSTPRPLRPDVEGPMLAKEDALRNAPAVNLEHFSIPKVMGG